MIILKISSKNFNKVIERAIKSIKKGEVIICPTDTIYGLVADARNKEAVKKIFRIKKRKSQKAIPIFVKDVKMVKKLVQVNKNQEKFLNKIWPGAVTVILKRKKDCELPKILFGREKTIGLRIPKYKLVNVLVKKLNRPLTGTSANISGKEDSSEIEKILSQFKNQKFQPDLVIDAGNLKKSKPSTIIDLTGNLPKILRKGENFKIELLKILR